MKISYEDIVWMVEVVGAFLSQSFYFRTPNRAREFLGHCNTNGIHHTSFISMP